MRLKGWRIEARNLKTPLGEIDLLAWQGEVLVIVEVKYRTTKSRWPLDLRQSQRLRRAALWIAANRQLIGGVRIDLVEVNPGRIPFFPLLDHLEADGSYEVRDVRDAYLDRVAGDVKLARPLRVVVDCGNGGAGVFADE